MVADDDRRTSESLAIPVGKRVFHPRYAMIYHDNPGYDVEHTVKSPR